MSLTSVPLRSRELYVLDSWPILEHLLRSASLTRLSVLMKAAENDEAILLMSEMNLGEVFYRIAKEDGERRAENSMVWIGHLPIHIIPLGQGDVLRAARLKGRFAISYADCFCAELAITHHASVVTGDPDFLQLERSGLLRLEWVGA